MVLADGLNGNSLLTYAFAKVVQLGTAYLTAGHNLYLSNLGGVYGEGALYALAICDLTHGESLIHAGTTLADDDALENLHAFLTTFDHAAVNLYSVTYVEGRYVVLQLFFFDCIENVHLVSFLFL